MTEERKQKLRQLLEEAMRSLEIRYEYRPLSLPVDVYRRYLEGRWASYGVEFLSFSFATRFTPHIADETAKSNLLDFIRKELAQFIRGDEIPISVCYIDRDSTDRSRVYNRGPRVLYLNFLLERLLDISLVQGEKAAISVFYRCSCANGAHGFFQDIALLKGIKLTKEVQVFEGVRLVPLLSRRLSDELVRYLPAISYNAFSSYARNFFGKTILVIDRPGFSKFHKISDAQFQNGTPKDELPFHVEVPDGKFPNSKVVNSFKSLFCQALSLVCNNPVQITHEGWFLEEDKSFNPDCETYSILQYINPLFRHFDSVLGYSNLVGGSTDVEETHIEEAKHLYDIMDKNSHLREKLRIPIDRWMKSKTPRNPIDQIIDLRIALEALYATRKTGVMQQVSSSGARHLGKGKAKECKDELRTKFEQIYRCCSDAVHDGQLAETAPLGDKRLPMSEFIAKAQNLCRTSIMKVLEEEEFPN